jgi:hypothetical protein
MGKPVWLLNRFDTCWRWFEHRDDSHWYPTLRLFRQTERGDWAGVIDRVAAALAADRRVRIDGWCRCAPNGGCEPQSADNKSAAPNDFRGRHVKGFWPSSHLEIVTDV